MFDNPIFEIVTFVLIIVAVITLALVGVTYGLDRPTCEAQTRDMQYPHRWSFWSGCQIEVKPNQWIPLENYRYFEE